MTDVVQVGWLHSPAEELTVLVLAHPHGDTLEIQRSTSRSHEQRDGQFGGYCLVRDAGPTYYGGVHSHRMDGDTLVLELTAEAASVLQLPPVVQFQLPAHETDQVRRWMAESPD